MQTDLSIYKDIIVPLLAAFVGGALGLVTALLVVSRSETLRRLAFWEPFAKDLWVNQVAVCIDVLSAASPALDAAVGCFNVFNPNQENRTRCAAELDRQLNRLAELKGRRLALCTPNFNQAVEEFVAQLGIIAFQISQRDLSQDLAQNLPSQWARLVDDTRIELRVERLDAQARTAIESACRAPRFNPTGNATLTY